MTTCKYQNKCEQANADDCPEDYEVCLIYSNLHLLEAEQEARIGLSKIEEYIKATSKYQQELFDRIEIERRGMRK